MTSEPNSDSPLELAHVLFTDIVGYSKLLSDKQRELFQLLNELIRNTAQFRAADAAGKLVRLPTGDGMALASLPAWMRRCVARRKSAGNYGVSPVAASDGN